MPDLLNKAEVTDLYSCLFLNENVFGLDVSMKEAVSVYVVQS